MAYHLRTLTVALLLGGAGVVLFRERLSRSAAWLRNRPTILWAAILLVALCPLIWTTRNVLHYAVNVPRFDDWEMARLIVKQHAGQLTWRDVFEQQEEARTVLPKLIFLFSAAGGKWDVRQQMAISLAAAALSACGILFLLRKSRLKLLGLAVTLWVAVLCIFSPAQVEVWMLASGFPSFLPALFLVAGLVAVRARLSVLMQFAICAAVSLASSFTLPNGLLAWGLTFPVLLMTRRIPRWRFWLGAWTAAIAVCGLVYFSGYTKPEYLPVFAPRASAASYLAFFLIFLGGGFAYASTVHPAVIAVCVGTLQLAMLAITAVMLWPHRRNAKVRADVAPWIALATNSIAAAVLATLGRVGYGAQYALASRYVPFSIYLAVADAALIAIAYRELVRRRLLLATNVVLCLAFAVLYTRAAATTLYFMRHDSARARLARGALLFSRVVDTIPVLREIYPPDPNLPARLAAELDAAKLLHPSLVRSATLSNLQSTELRVAGKMERQFAGWAALLSKERPADCVLLAYDTPTHESVAFAIADRSAPRYDIARQFGNADLLWSGWSATPRSDAIPAGAKITAWAVDADEAKVYRLEDESQSRRRDSNP